MSDCTTGPDNVEGGAEPIYLCDRSSTGRKRPWRWNKIMSSRIAESMRRINKAHPKRAMALKGRAERMARCAQYIVFGEYVSQETGEVTQRLDAVNFCRDRLCPMCQWRKSLVTFSQVSTIMDVIQSQYPEAVPIFLTLTMQNVTSDELSDGVTRILKAWSTLTASRTNPVLHKLMIGWFRTLEITFNAVTQEWHPHIHAIILVSQEYFDDKSIYMTNQDWQAQWRKALRVDYDPVVDIRRIYNERAHAVAEVSKYAVKPGEWVSDDNCVTDANVELLANVLKGRRLVAFGGEMLEVRKALKQEDADNADLVNTDCDTDNMRDDIRIAMLRYNWQSGLTNNYVFAGRDDLTGGGVTQNGTQEEDRPDGGDAGEVDTPDGC